MQIRRVPAATAAVSTLLLVVAGCGLTDDRPASDYGALADALRALPAASSVEGPSPDGGATALTLALDEDADTASLRTTGSRAFSLVNDHRYPDGPPHVTVSSGPFTGDVPMDSSSSCNCVPEPENIDLSVLPLLHTLPGVSTGSLPEVGRAAQITLDPDVDVRKWAEDAAAQAADQATDIVKVLATGPADESPQYRMDLGPGATEEAVSTLHQAADEAGADVAGAEIILDDPADTGDDAEESASVSVGGELTVATDEEVVPTQRVLLAHVAEALDTFTVEADSGLSVDGPGDSADLDAVEAAIDLLTDAEVTTASATAGDGVLTAHAVDASGLRDAARLVASPDWPLDSRADVTLRHEQAAGTGSVFTAHSWPDHVGLLDALWEAGFTSVDAQEITHAADLRLRISRSTGPDPRTPQGRSALVDALRAGGWEGTAEILFTDEDHLSFYSTADGRAQEAANRLAGADRTPSGWEQEFLDAWDATATTG